MTGCRRNRHGGVLTGVIIVAVGVFLLLSQMGILHFYHAWRLWPAALVLFGFAKFFDTPTPAHRVWGTTLIVIGALVLWHYFGNFRYGMDELWPLFIVGGGLSLLLQAYWRQEGQFDSLPPGGSLNSINVFGGTDRKIRDRNFKGGTIFACFGGFQIDLTQADIDGDQAVIEATAVFGGGEIRVPQSWNVVVEGTGVFGGYEDSSFHNEVAGQQTKTLIVRGAAIFGGVEVKN